MRRELNVWQVTMWWRPHAIEMESRVQVCQNLAMLMWPSHVPIRHVLIATTPFTKPL